MTYFSRVTSVIALLAAVLALAACSASSRVVRTHDGPAQDASQVAVLFKPGDIKIEEVDGKPVKTYLFDNLEMNYELLPGPHTVVFRYNKVWAISGVKRDSGDKAAEEIQSGRLQVTFNAQAGRTYRFELPEAASREDAIRIASGRNIQVVDDAGQSLARAVPYAPPAAETETAVAGQAPVAPAGQPAVAPETVPPQVSIPAAQGGRVSNLEALKVLWESASTEEKKEFLRWAFQ